MCSIICTLLIFYFRRCFMAKGLEIERKFLVELPDVRRLDVKRKIGITQTYLNHGKDKTQRRVRRIAENGSITYTYTEKVFISAITREENEYEISREEYDRLLGQSDKSVRPVENIELFYYATTHAVLLLCKKLASKESVLRQDKRTDKAAEIRTLIRLILAQLKGEPA